MLVRDGNAELDEGVVCPGDVFGLVYRDGVEGGKNRVQKVTGGVDRSFYSLGESQVSEVFE